MHRDLKLANILLTAKGDDANVRVADFGFAKVLQNDLATTQLGTPIFMAPEIFNEDHYSYKADVWSLGVLSYEILTGISAFNCRSIAQLQRMQREEVKFPENCELSKDVKDFVKVMLTYEHERRPSFQQLKQMPYIQSLFAKTDPEHSAEPSEEHKAEEEALDYEILREVSEDEYEPEHIEVPYEESKNCDDKPEVRMEPNYWELASKTRDLDSKLTETEEFMQLQSNFNEDIAKMIGNYCKKRYEILYEEAKKMIISYNLTDSDYFFYEIYQKIQSNLRMISRVPLNSKSTEILFEEAKNISENSPNHKKHALLLLNVALDMDPENKQITQLYNEVFYEYQNASLHCMGKNK